MKTFSKLRGRVLAHSEGILREKKENKSVLLFGEVVESGPEMGVSLGESVEEKEKKGRQMVLNFGQKRYTKCHVCGVLYSESIKSEVRMHEKIHKRSVSDGENRPIRRKNR